LGGVDGGILSANNKKELPMSFPIISPPGVYIGPGAVSGGWNWDFGGNGWPGNVIMLPQPFGPLPSLPPIPSPILTSTLGVRLNDNGSYSFFITITNTSTTNQSVYFGIQVSSNL
jgi:hypothetical protein